MNKFGFYLTTGLLITKQAVAESFAFKQTIAPKQGWLLYFLATLALVAMVYVLAKKSKQGLLAPSNCQIIDKKRLGSKTIVYVFEYQNQQFLLADNQQALALHALDKEI
jgi:flagellar biogenesis protein FliO